MAISICAVSLIFFPIEPSAPKWTGSAGAVVDFWGVVRTREGEQEITGIEYTAHERMARHRLECLASEAAAEFHLVELILTHRIGFVPVAEPSLFLRTMSAHREAAFSASRWLIEELKRSVPIWKKPVYAGSPASLTCADSKR